jgi:hypothetical protein
MVIAVQTWNEFKSIMASKNLVLQFYDLGSSYSLWAFDSSADTTYTYIISQPTFENAQDDIRRVTSERQDFELNYKYAIHTPLTYSATVNGLNVVTPALDIFEIDGSGTKIIEVTQIGISGTATTGITVDVLILKRNSLNIGGSLTNPTAIPYISYISTKVKPTGFIPVAGTSIMPSAPSAPSTFYNMPTPLATATLKAYTDNGVLGNLVGNVRATKLSLLPSTTAQVPTLFNFNGLRLNGVNESVCINMNGVSIVGPSVNIYIEWIERIKYATN